MRIKRVTLFTLSSLGAIIMLSAFIFYFWHLFARLETNFEQEDEFKPTRIYSDVYKIAPPQTRGEIEARLKALGYTVSVTPSVDSVNFTLHSISYPLYLLPDNHPTLQAQQKPVTLHFDSHGSKAMLISISTQGSEIPDLYLEPELITTLTRTARLANKEAGQEKIRDLVNFEEVPARLWQAIISIEDQHFLQHKGMDPRGMARAAWVNLRTLSFSQGGSTITQQLVKNLTARRTKNLFLKINELFLALILETKYTKEEILTRYLNEVYLGNIGSLEIHGVSEGAKFFFSKSLEELSLSEMALMAGLIRGPAYYSPYKHLKRAMERQSIVLQKMTELGYIAPEEARAASKSPPRLSPPKSAWNKAPYFTDYAKAELIRALNGRLKEDEIVDSGFKVYTTLDVHMNHIAQKAIFDGVNEVEKRFGIKPESELVIEGALASVDHHTGAIRALVGGRSYARSNFNRILNMKRQVGSTFKPIVYLTAFNKSDLNLNPASPFEDAPWNLSYDNGKQKWSPKNYEKEYMGWIPLRTALAHSVNTVAAKLAIQVGLKDIIETGHLLGIESKLPEVPSLALGVAELSPVELLKVYSAIANHGIQDDLTVIRGITQEDNSPYAHFSYSPKEVYPSGPVDLLVDTMQSVFTEGTASSAARMGFDRPAAGKTGTTSNHRDSWFAGFTPNLTTVVWVGVDHEVAKQPSPTPVPEKGKKKKEIKVDLTGANSALPIWVRFMKESLEGEAPVNFQPSPSLTTLKIDRHTGKTAAFLCSDSQVIYEKVVVGHEPTESTCAPDWPLSSTETEVP